MSRQPKNDFPKPDTCTVQLADPHKFARCLRCMLTESYGFDFSIARISEFCFCITDRYSQSSDARVSPIPRLLEKSSLCETWFYNQKLPCHISFPLTSVSGGFLFIFHNTLTTSFIII
ncbi:MAG: hypothetical protein UU08_C0001G0049 [Candidatus Uhrbacteria bacterium GW2011_GWE2_40_58]|nr:MAG: hypothetical protein UU08_C0001G0049 [Candidatus Uhrbacteria bacterium GW2011_GWE2_40_58]